METRPAELRKRIALDRQRRRLAHRHKRRGYARIGFGGGSIIQLSDVRQAHLKISWTIYTGVNFHG